MECRLTKNSKLTPLTSARSDILTQNWAFYLKKNLRNVQRYFQQKLRFGKSDSKVEFK